MKNSKTSITEKLTSKYLEVENNKNHQKSTNINILLNRVKSNQKNEMDALNAKLDALIASLNNE